MRVQSIQADNTKDTTKIVIYLQFDEALQLLTILGAKSVWDGGWTLGLRKLIRDLYAKLDHAIINAEREMSW